MTAPPTAGNTHVFLDGEGVAYAQGVKDGTAAERERIRQLAREHRAVYFTGNSRDGIEPSPFADLIGDQP